MKKLIISFSLLVASSVTGLAAVTVLADPEYDTDGGVFTVDPEANSPAERGLKDGRILRQTFQVSEAFDVGSMIFSLDTTTTGTGFSVSVFEIANVNASSWSPLNEVASFNILPDSMVLTDQRIGIYLSGDDIFSLGASNGDAGYGIQFEAIDANGAPSADLNVGNFRHSNTTSTVYGDGAFYIESGVRSSTTNDRDLGINLIATTGVSAIPEPSGVLALGCLFGASMLTRRRS